MAESQARRRGKPLAALIEDALRTAFGDKTSDSQVSAPTQAMEGLDDGDPFFRALDEIRSRGCLPVPHRDIELA